jgi:hypothetical protein
MVKASIKTLLGGFGLEVIRKSNIGNETCGFFNDFDREANEKIEIVRQHTMLPYTRLYSLYDQAVYCETEDIPGSFVECGTWKGGAVGLMALANLAHGQARRHIHLFDSFVGIPEPDEAVDGPKAINEAKQAGGGTQGRLEALTGLYESAGTLEDNRQLLEVTIRYDPGYLHYHQGWFQDTLPRKAGQTGEIAILRLDGDWYASTKVCLEYLFHRVVSGGFVIIDDYGRYDGCKKAVDEFLRSEGIRTYLHRIDSEGRYLVKA